jgi:hypothetical protein
LIRINGAIRVPRRIEDKTTFATDGKHYIASRKVERLASVADQQAAIGGYPTHFIKWVTAAG